MKTVEKARQLEYCNSEANYGTSELAITTCYYSSPELSRRNKLTIVLEQHRVGYLRGKWPVKTV